MSTLQPKGFFTSLPYKIDYCLFLIQEELKSRRFFGCLYNAGVDDFEWQPHLDRVILSAIGFDDGTDEIGEFYNEIMERRCKKIRLDNDSIVTQAFKAYMELISEKRKRKITKRRKNSS